MNFKEAIIENIKDGILILVKYGLIIAAIVYAFLLMNNTYQMSVNGNNAALLIREYQVKGWLPPVNNGQIPEHK